MRKNKYNKINRNSNFLSQSFSAISLSYNDIVSGVVNDGVANRDALSPISEHVIYSPRVEGQIFKGMLDACRNKDKINNFLCERYKKIIEDSKKQTLNHNYFIKYFINISECLYFLIKNIYYKNVDSWVGEKKRISNDLKFEYFIRNYASVLTFLIPFVRDDFTKKIALSCKSSAIEKRSGITDNMKFLSSSPGYIITKTIVDDLNNSGSAIANFTYPVIVSYFSDRVVGNDKKQNYFINDSDKEFINKTVFYKPLDKRKIKSICTSIDSIIERLSYIESQINILSEKNKCSGFLFFFISIRILILTWEDRDLKEKRELLRVAKNDIEKNHHKSSVLDSVERCMSGVAIKKHRNASTAFLSYFFSMPTKTEQALSAIAKNIEDMQVEYEDFSRVGAILADR